MPQKPFHLAETASQTAGPYVHIGLAPAAAGFRAFDRDLGTRIAGTGAAAPDIRIEGRVFDGIGTVVKDTLIEVWQADPNGIYPHPDDPRAADAAPGFCGWGRVMPDLDTGLWQIDTVRPGPVPGPRGTLQAPHLTLWIVARGINIGLHTRLYFPEAAALLASDPLLCLIDTPARRATLIAANPAPGQYVFDIHLQGDRETVFLDI